MKKSIFCTLALLLNACMPNIQPLKPNIHSAHLTAQHFVTEDGSRLPYKTWLAPPEQQRAVLIAVHGFNDYSNFFDLPGRYLKAQGVGSYAYDQRGFGMSPHTGLWAGVERYRNDLTSFARLIKQRHPNQPIYLLGESMGGAVVIVTLAHANAPEIDGIILAAPAVWSRNTMPWYQRGLLWSLAHTLPWMTLTGEGIAVTPSDNIDMLRALGRDPNIIKATRVDSMYGLANLMDAAYASAERLDARQLLLYGEKDDIIPKQPVYQFINNLDLDNKTIALYENGYHMLLRDLQRQLILDDIIAWIEQDIDTLPSGANRYALKKIPANDD